MPPNNVNDDREWRDDRKLVLHELDRLNLAIEKLDGKIESRLQSLDSRMSDQHTDLVMLKTKASVWGAVTGTIVSVITTLIGYLTTR